MFPFMGCCHALFPGDGKLNDDDPFLHSGLHDNVWPESGCCDLSLEDQLLSEVRQYSPV